MKPRTINQINSFSERNPVAIHYLKFKDVRNLTIDKAWFEYTSSELFRPIGRYTLRGNFIYSNLIKSVSAYIGIDLNNLDYSRDTITMDIEDIRYAVRMDVINGVTIEYTLPFKGPHYNYHTFMKHPLRANVPFEKEAIRPFVERIHAGHFFPENTALGKVQRKCRVTKKEAVVVLRDFYKEKPKVYQEPSEEIIDKSLTRRLRKKFNVRSEVQITLPVYQEILKRSAGKRGRVWVKKFNVSEILDSTDFDGDVDEAIDRLGECFEANTLYV